MSLILGLSALQLATCSSPGLLLIVGSAAFSPALNCWIDTSEVTGGAPVAFGMTLGLMWLSSGCGTKHAGLVIVVLMGRFGTFRLANPSPAAEH